MSDRKISVFIKEPGKKPRHVHISRSLENLQKTVGGYVEKVKVSSDLMILCCEDGKIFGLDYNFTLGADFVGTVIFCGEKRGEFSDVPCSFGRFKRLFPFLFEEA